MPGSQNILAWLIAGLLALATAGPVSAQARKAFVVGNSAYVATTPLANPGNDARDLAAKLSALGYQVTLGVDVTRAQFLKSFQDFSRALTADDVALFFFAGHGLQIGGENYLFPVDARVTKEADVRANLVPLNALLADLTRTTRNRVVILDACRNNPFADPIGQADATRSAGGGTGLARVYAGVGSFIAYSTQPGNVALDGTGRNSPFTAALLKHMPEPGLDVHAVMRRVRGDVGRATGERQVPWENSSLVDEIAFGGGPGGSVPGVVVAPKPAVTAGTKTTAAETFHYVTGLDANGDNFLALRAGASADAVRIATMGPGTLLKVAGQNGPWRQVVLSDGTTGWAHSNWLGCCRTASGVAASSAQSTPVSGRPQSGPSSCDALWTERNAIWHRYGYCFTAERGQKAFGNAGCSRTQAEAQAAMSASDKARVDALVALEQRAGCR